MTDSVSTDTPETPDPAASTTTTATVTTTPPAPPAAETTPPVAPAADAADNAPIAEAPPEEEPATPPPAPEPAPAPAPEPVVPTPSVTTSTDAPVAAPVPAPAPTSFIGSLDAIIKQTKLDDLGIANMAEEVQQYILHVLEKGNQLTKDWVLHQLSYLKAMSPTTPTTVAVGARHQENYYREMMNALDNNTGQDFREMMNAVLAIIHQTKTSGAHAFHLWARFLPDWNLGQQERQKFLNLGTLFRTTSDGSTRQMALKQIDLAKALDGLLPSTKEKLENYFRAS